MGSVAKRLVPGFLATAKENRFGLFGLEWNGRKPGSFVAAVAKRLRGASAAGTPGIGLAFLDLDAIRGLLCYDRLIHVLVPYRWRNLAAGSLGDPQGSTALKGL